MAFAPHFAFNGTCALAFHRYQEVFGGELRLIRWADVPTAVSGSRGVDPEAIMHASLDTGSGILMGADAPGGTHDGMARATAFSTADGREARRVFDCLRIGGTIQMPFGETFFSPGFGMCTDAFGIQWMVSTDPS